MNCHEFMRFIDERPLRERTSDEMQIARMQADRCPDCARYLDEAMQLEREIFALPEIAPSEDFTQNVLRRAQSAAPAKGRPVRRRGTRLLPAATMLAGALVVTTVFVHQIHPYRWLERLFALPAGLLDTLYQPMPHRPDLDTLITVAGAVLMAAAFLLPSEPADHTDHPASR